MVAAGSAVEASARACRCAWLRRPTVTRELKGDEHSYEVAAADQYVEVVAEQQGTPGDGARGATGQKLIESTPQRPTRDRVAGTHRGNGRDLPNRRACGREERGAWRISHHAARAPNPEGLDRVLEQARRMSVESRSLRAKGAYGEALAPALAALALREQALGADDVLVGDSLHSLAMLYDDTAEYVKAEPLNLRALAITGESPRARPSGRREDAQHLAWIAAVRHDYAQAEDSTAAPSLSERPRPNDPEVATTLNDFALLYNDKAPTSRPRAQPSGVVHSGASPGVR